ncbi:MAG: dihydrofolate reductase family protein [Chloroflexota bacterium]
MGRVISDMSMSLDGFIAKRNGDDGGLNHWVFSGNYNVQADGMTFSLTSEKSANVFREFVQNAGAFVVGRRTFEAGGAVASFQLPTFVLTRTMQKSDDPRVTFITDNIETALQKAHSVAEGKAVYIGGGADVAQQYLRACLIDELHINLVPTVFGEGIRLLDKLNTTHLKVLDVIEGDSVTHINRKSVQLENAAHLR